MDSISCFSCSMFFLLCLIASTHSYELQYLMKFKSYFQKSNASVFSSWTQSNSPCNFNGIVCNSNRFVSEIHLADSQLVGSIPLGIGNLTQLEILDLSSNHLSGEIPHDIVKLPRLWQHKLHGNNISGEIPAGFGNLTNLVYFNASGNQLEGDLFELRSLTKLASLQLYENQFSGAVPQEFGEFKSLTELSLYKNKLTGPLPQKLGSWVGMNFIDVSFNFLSGPIPPHMCKNNQMTYLVLSNNNFTGRIPKTYVNCLSMSGFLLDRNSFSGVVPPGIWGLSNLTSIDLSKNQFNGSITLDVAKPKSLFHLILSDNQFSGVIPQTIGKLKNLTSLDLSRNNLSGLIPDSIGSCTSLTDINLAGNSLSGEIPASIGHLRTLVSLNLSTNKLSGEIPSSLSSSSHALAFLDLSNNQLFGPIPNSIAIYFKDGFVGNPGLCSNTLTNFHACSSHSHGLLRNLVVCFIVALILVTLAYCLFMKRKQYKIEKALKSDSWDFKKYHPINFDADEIIEGIKDENLIGRGGSGSVYKVVLRSGQEVAVKQKWTAGPSGQGGLRTDSSNDVEVTTLSSIRHVNVVKLYSSITSEDRMLLVFELLKNGSLWDKLHTSRENTRMGWEVRYGIALGAAKGLKYLHHGCQRPILHRDIKSGNILLDEEWKPRITDFGIAKIVQEGGASSWTSVMAGTYGYIAPEYAYTRRVTEKSDVYSFGVVLMELVTGKRPVEPEFGENKDIVFWICSNMSSREKMLELVDSAIAQQFKEDAVKVLKIAALCTFKSPASRPSMKMVVQMLEEAKPNRPTNITEEAESSNQPYMIEEAEPTPSTPNCDHR